MKGGEEHEAHKVIDDPVMMVGSGYEGCWRATPYVPTTTTILHEIKK